MPATRGTADDRRTLGHRLPAGSDYGRRRSAGSGSAPKSKDLKDLKDPKDPKDPKDAAKPCIEDCENCELEVFAKTRCLVDQEGRKAKNRKKGKR